MQAPTHEFMDAWQRGIVDIGPGGRVLYRWQWIEARAKAQPHPNDLVTMFCRLLVDVRDNHQPSQKAYEDACGALAVEKRASARFAQECKRKFDERDADFKAAIQRNMDWEGTCASITAKKRTLQALGIELLGEIESDIRAGDHGGSTDPGDYPHVRRARAMLGVVPASDDVGKEF